MATRSHGVEDLIAAASDAGSLGLQIKTSQSRPATWAWFSTAIANWVLIPVSMEKPRATLNEV